MAGRAKNIGQRLTLMSARRSEAQMMTLETKIDAAHALLDKLLDEHGPGNVAVAWTGGKDSTVALNLWQGLLLECGQGPARALSIDTGLKFPQITTFRDQWAKQWGLDLVLARPEIDLSTYPVAKNKLSCCAELKVKPLKHCIRMHGFSAVVTGLRRDEHLSRQNREFLEARHDPEYVQVNVILDFTEMDVWAYITSRGLPFCSLYAQGYRSLGCVPCTVKSDQGERSGRNLEKESQLETLKSLGYF